MFTNSFRAEVLKSRNSLPLWLSIAGTVTLEPGFLLLHLFGVAGFDLPATGNPWPAFVLNHYRGLNFMLLPLFVVILASLVAYQEHRNGMWKHLFVQTVHRREVYLAKLVYTLVLFAAAHLLFVLTMLMAGLLLGLLRSDAGLLSHAPDLGQIALLYARTILSILGLLGLQYWISMRFSVFLVPLTAGIIGYVGTTLLIGAPWAALNPYAFSTLYLAEYADGTSGFTWIDLYSLMYFVCFTVLGVLDFQRGEVD